MEEPTFPTTTLPAMNISDFMTNPEQKLWKGPFRFICGADTQLGLIDRYILKLPTPNWDKEIKLTKESIDRANSMIPKPKFYVICGDMLDAFPYDGEQEELRNKQYEAFVRLFSELDSDIKLVCVCGNHDIGDKPSAKGLQIYRKQFGSDIFSFWVGGVKFVVLNSQYFQAPDAMPDQTRSQLNFLKTEIADPQAKHIVVFQHIPFFVDDPSEDDKYFNINSKNRIMLLELLLNAGVKHVFCGHYHKNGGGTYKSLEVVVTSAVGGPLGNDPSGFRVVDVNENAISHEYVAFRSSPRIEEI